MKRNLSTLLRKRGEKDRGSALLVTLMVLVGLSMLGLGFVAVSETESAISTNERNSVQTLDAAEAGAKTVIEWFQDPDWATAQGLMPAIADKAAYTRQRKQNAGATLTFYKSTSGAQLCDKPFKPARVDRLYGDQAHADIIIDAVSSPDTAKACAFLNNFNTTLFGTAHPTESGEVTSILIYAPPIVGANVNADGFYEDGAGTRMGLATILVTATKFKNAAGLSCASPMGSATNPIIGQHQVRMVIAEWPFPGPQGPIQSNANIDTNGNMQVHWGKVTSEGYMTLKRPFVGMPWFDAYEKMHFEHGFDTNVWPTTAGFYDGNNWLYQLVGRSLADPWYEARARGDLTNDGTGGPPQPFKYQNLTDPVTTQQSNFFQAQITNQPPDLREVLFPRIDYNFWKDIATSADDQDGIFYLRWVSGNTFQDKVGTQHDIRDWIDVMNGGGITPAPRAGFYFFDTQNQQNPQNGGGGVLTPDVAFRGGSMQAQGFIYLNVATFQTQGLGGQTGWYNMPGEPYRDIGYLRVDEDPASPAYKNFANNPDNSVTCVPATHVNCFLDNAQSGAWEYQDLAWSNGAAAKNNLFDMYLIQRTFVRPDGTTCTNCWMPVPYYNGCHPGTNAALGVDPLGCSEPAEPYLNLIYPTAPGAVSVGWENPTAQTKISKVTSTGTLSGTPLGGGVSNTCLQSATAVQCTSNGYDRDGALVQLDPAFYGVVYVEGQFDTTGNATYYGSLLVNQDATKAGTPDIYFDESLIKGNWPPKSFRFPRVYTSASQTDQ